MEAHIDGVDAATAEGLKNFLLAQIKNSSSPQVAPVGTVPNVPVAPASPAIPMNTVAVADISSTMYPLSTTWLFAQTVGSFPFVIIFSFILSITLFAHPTRSSLAQFIINQIPYLLMNILGLELLVVGFIAVFRSNYAFSFMPDFVLYRTGYITVQERHIPYIKIQDVTISQGVVDKLFGIYTVTLENAAQQMYGRGAQNARVAIMNLTREQADAIAARIRVLMGQGGNM
jgi:membrane protein YdbS with pleckstrin-like domain